METILVSFVVMLLVMLGMAVGVLFGRDAIKGSCGGLNAVDGDDSECSVCSRPVAKCRKKAKIQGEHHAG